ncbi:MAG: retroviral-like aspartic protease family protein [Pseudomonadales bacterium]|nr:retroviral-like aspartic protease family protein [Pseudomonadales bacterium]
MPKKNPFDKSEVIQLIGMMLAITIVTAGIWLRNRHADKTAPDLDAQIPSSRILPSGDIEVTLKSKRNGHYTFIGEINGQPVTFFYDTGASRVAIPVPVANYLELTKGYPSQTHTANGTTTSFSTRLNQIKVGDIELHNIPAGIVKGLEGKQILLGMSFLRHVEISQSNGMLKLTQHSNHEANK